ncbi:pyridoxamine 5'-phosphate oxidase family protein [Winogradskyella alexanderae]|uniref:Pyridoxamine 5'-phosphate oxidase family protein n=1 Tax=Winogradskyella alexanderae TaxID=2877123 RepID=A0ABS7XTM4_9FLAO|nr:pyridoxamine 5'-phosphate oxidase family protein [Winogradskyella alexanderae]MCA0132744.1 pyridoxamine 5'-phosphate oxidase family protein [Winogradskyella alexanderae]
MELSFLRSCKRELINGYAKKRHPFRYFSLATTSNGMSRQRTVVLRKLLSDFTFVIYTDSRSQKVMDIRNNNSVSGLFYHPKKLLQIRVEGKAEIITDKAILNEYWKNINENSRKDYTTYLKPGSLINNPDDVSYNLEANNFCVIHIIPNSIEYLQLKRPNHLRILFTKSGADWKGQFIVP